MKGISFLFLLFLPVYILSQSDSPLKFSEVMFYPSEQNGEFVEIFNTSLTDTIDLTGYKFKYYTSSNNNIVPFIGGTKLAPQKFAVILQGNYDFNNGIYKSLIPTDVIILKISSNNFGSSGMANTTSRTINLINPAGQIVDSYTYSADNSSGISDEKIILNKDNSSNWQNSLRINGTPGFKNSVSPADYDLQIKFHKIEPLIPRAEDSLKITFIVLNKGRLVANNFSVNIFNDINYDSTEQAEENIFYQDFTELYSGDSLVIQKSIYVEVPTNYLFIASVNFLNDEVFTNNRAIANVTVLEKLALYNDIVINEIMYAPQNDEPEWIELYNRSNRKINLKNWKVGDNSTLTNISNNECLIQPGEYLILTRDSSIINFYSSVQRLILCSLPTLNNNGDVVVIKDIYNNAIDSVRYFPDWGGSGGKSLERKSVDLLSNEKNNWGTSVSKYRATPCKINSISEKDYDLSVISFLSKSNYAEVDKKLELNVIIKNNGRKVAENFEVELYKDLNLNGVVDEVLYDKTIITNLINNQEVQVTFLVNDVVYGNNQFILHINFANDEFDENNYKIFSINGVIINEEKNDLVVNEIMYAPISPEPEWIEIYNRSNKLINLKGYKVGDKTNSNVIIKEDKIIKPNEFYVVAKDSIITSLYDNIDNLIISNFPVLNNNEGVIVITDSLNRVIDSVSYKSNWGGKGGKSLERIDAELSSLDSSNWKSPINLKGTPGKKNSVTPFNYDIQILCDNVEQINSTVDDTTVLKFIIYNKGKNIANNFVLLLYEDVNCTSLINEMYLINRYEYAYLSPGDSMIFYFKTKEYNVGEKCLIAKVIFDEDEYDSNNIVYLKYNIQEKPPEYNDVVINEIMFAPDNDEPEWIELFNRSNRIINLKNWKVGDSITLSEITTNDYQLEPKEYLIISRESSINNFYSGIDNLLIANLPVFNNNGDNVVVKDSNYRTIDSMKYYSSWGTKSGISLERVNTDSSSISKNNWKNSISNFQATPGKINSVSPKNYDVEINFFGSITNFVELGENATLKCIVKNTGNQKAENVELLLFKDENKNGILDESYLDKKIIEIEPHNFIDIEFSVSKITEGNNNFILRANYSQDEYLENNIAYCMINGVIINVEKYDIVINEIMYAPDSPEPEWIELYNRSNKLINLMGYKIGNSKTKSIITNQELIFRPDSYIVVSRDSSIFSIYPEIQNVVVCSFPLLNNYADVIIISDSLNRTIDSVYYKSLWGDGNGNSLERIDYEKSSTDSTNWKSAFNRSTPCSINSVSKRNYDLAIINYDLEPAVPSINDNIKLILYVKNYGRYSADGILKIFKSESNLLIKQLTLPSIQADSSTAVIVDDVVTDFISKIKLEVTLENNLDDVLSNNTLDINIYPKYSPNSILINEIMYYPENGEPEWIEIFNASDYDIDLEGWSIKDVLKSSVQTKIKNGVITRKSFAVISKDSSIINYHKNIPSSLIVNPFANLNNDEDGVVIKDFYGFTIDSVYYDKSYGGLYGKSLERKSLSVSSIEKNNWGSSSDLELSTPGRINSIYRKVYDLILKNIFVEPQNPYAGEKVNIITRIFNNSLISALNFSVKIYYWNKNQYEFFDELSGNNLLPNDSLDLKSDKKLELSNDVKIFCKIIFNEDEDTLNNFLEKQIRIQSFPRSVMINEIMYNPFDDESEWIEIVNVSDASINLKEWMIADIFPEKTKSVITNKDDYLLPNEYAIITNDTSKFAFKIQAKIYQAKFGALNNSGDGIVIYDYNGRTIDSVFYNSNWGNQKGYSLERKSFSASTDSTNWFLSISKSGATPGLENSVIKILSYEKNSIVINEIMYEPGESNSEFIELFNTTDDTVQIGGMKLYVNNNKLNLVSHYFKLIPGAFFVVANDSSIFVNYELKDYENVFINKSLSLPNTGAKIILKDFYGAIIDSLNYMPDWHNRNFISVKNKSLERINPYLNSDDNTNWSTSVSNEGATPLKKNSLFTEILNNKSKVTIYPNPFSPDNDGYEDFTIINFDLPYKISQARIRLFDSQGRLVRTIKYNMPSASHNSFIYDGLDDSGRPLRVGIYVLLIEIISDNGVTEVIKTPLVIARKL
ncbi:lamin tail domain-containing protein [Rosettibacter firmus]|uniref:lamin tail domain-containing protein n=1 Tax=Rosettibacter firmus TaxID=3111522 RepID=UPI00336C016F